MRPSKHRKILISNNNSFEIKAKARRHSSACWVFFICLMWVTWLKFLLPGNCLKIWPIVLLISLVLLVVAAPWKTNSGTPSFLLGEYAWSYSRNPCKVLVHILLELSVPPLLHHVFRGWNNLLYSCQGPLVLVTVSLNTALQRYCPENWEKIFRERKLHGLSPSFYIHISVSNLFILTIDLPIWLQQNKGPILGIYKSLTDVWIWKLGTRPRSLIPGNT
jgi:hypothetical protein